MVCAVSAGCTTSKHNFFAFLLSCSFISGFLSGVYVASQNAADYSLLISSAAASPATLISLISHTVCAFALTAVTYKFGRGYIFLLAFAEAFTFGIVATAVYYSYGSAQWLIQWGMLFFRTVTLIMLFWFWCRNVSGYGRTARRDIPIALFISVLAAIIDLCLIAPYLSYLFEHSGKVCSYVGFGSCL